MIAMLLDPDTSQYIKHLNLKTRAVYETILDSRLTQIRTNTGFHWLGRLKTTNELVGAVNLSLISGTQKMQLGFQLQKKFWGKGFATELAQSVLQVGIEEKGLTTIYGVFEKDNIASKNVLEKMGFKVETKDALKEAGVITYRFLASPQTLTSI